MRRVFRKIMVCILMLAVLVSNMSYVNNNHIEVNAAAYSDEIRACWLSYIDIQNYLCDKNEALFKSNLENIYNKMLDNSLNTVIVHVRSNGDAIYPSKIYPWATFISSSRKNPGYDPLKIMIDMAHKKGLRFEAWINPYRLANGNYATEEYKKTDFYKKYKNYIVEYNNSGKCLALNPGKAEARNIIVDGVKEIVKNYDVDGIHFDDYFYMDGMCPNVDSLTRKKNVNSLILKVYSSIKAIKKNCQFGISPQGNLDNCRNIGADIDTWLSQNGYVDYIMPQIYWTDNYKSSYVSTNIKMFSTRCEDWKNINKIDVPMYAGLALYRVGEKGSSDLDWGIRTDNIVSQYIKSKQYGFKGFSLFRYAWLDYANNREVANKKIAEEELNNLNRVLKGNEEALNSTYISYMTHVQTFGWQGIKSDGVVAGTTGLAKRLEAICINLGDKAGDGSVEYRTHVQSYGWTPWVSDGAISGTEGEAKRLEAIQIRLKGDVAKQYDICYRVHVQSYGWLDWAYNGEAAGSATLGKRLEAIEIKLVKKGTSRPAATSTPYVTRLIMYNTHCQTYGWLPNSFDGEMSGTFGQAKRLEGIHISIADKLYGGDVIYRTHCQTYGWLPWVKNGALSGTTGQSKRLEAIEIKLTGKLAEKYDIYYTVHCQTYGWMPWVKNGATAGTVGQAKRLEAIRIKLVPKGQPVK